MTLTSFEVARIVNNELGSAASLIMLTKSGGISFVLYEAFLIEGAQDSYGSGTSWGFGVTLGEHSLSSVLGNSLTLLSDQADIRQALRSLKRYGELRLGEEYLTAYWASRPTDSN